MDFFLNLAKLMNPKSQEIKKSTGNILILRRVLPNNIHTCNWVHMSKLHGICRPYIKWQLDGRTSYLYKTIIVSNQIVSGKMINSQEMLT